MSAPNQWDNGHQRVRQSTLACFEAGVLGGLVACFPTGCLMRMDALKPLLFPYSLLFSYIRYYQDREFKPQSLKRLKR